MTNKYFPLLYPQLHVLASSLSRIKLKATNEGIARAHKLAIKLASEKASNTFNWKDWELEKQGLTIRAKRSNNSVEKWVKRFKQNWWSNRDIRTTAQQTQAVP